MEKQCELSWNLKTAIKDVVIDKVFNIPKGENETVSAEPFDTKGKNFGNYDFIYIKIAFVGYAGNQSVTKLDYVDTAFINLSYDSSDPNHRFGGITPHDSVSGNTVTISGSKIIDNPPEGWSEEQDGKAKANALHVDAWWKAIYKADNQTYTYTFYAGISWVAGKILAWSHNPDKDDSVTIRVTIEGYKGYDHQPSSSSQT